MTDFILRLTHHILEVGWSKCPTNPWADGVLLVVTDHIQVRLGQAKGPTNPWVGGVLLIVTDHIQTYVRLG